MKKILIIEDEDLIRMGLEDDFRLEGYEVDSSERGDQGFDKALKGDFDIILLDIMLPEMNGFDVCRKLRHQGVRTPIIMLTAKGQEIDRVAGLEMGADDYVTKPFSPRELQARVRAILRRTEHTPDPSHSSQIKAEDLVLDLDNYKCHKNGNEINLTHLEFDILKYLIENRSKVVERDQLIDEVWGDSIIISQGTINTHMANLRKKIEDDVASPRYILSIRGIGYKFI